MAVAKSKIGLTPQVAALAHYTNLAGLLGIINSGELWASNVAFLNDREELLHGVKCARRALSTILKDTKLLQWRHAIGEVVKEIEGGRLPNTYAACLCEKSDLLSQWRGYGGREQGVCLVFDPAAIDVAALGKRAFLAPVQYGLVKGKMTLREGLRTRLLAIGDNFDDMDEGQRLAKVYDALSELIPRFKHIGFDGELEWRLVVQHATLRSSVSFRPNGNVLVPYIKLPVDLSSLKYVRIGPGADLDLTERSIALLLEARDLDVPIRRSRVPFRS